MSFDDGSRSQLNIAVPIMDQYKIRGTFYVNPKGEDWEERLDPWRDVAANGHEIGNHSINHICSRNFDWGPDTKSLETTTLEEIEADVKEAERRIRKLIPGQTTRTFAYPCYQDYVGEGPSRRSYVPVIARHFPAARGKGEAANHPRFTDLHYLTSWTAAGWMSGQQLCGFPDTAAEQGRWGILAFHGFRQGESSPWEPGSYSHGGPVSARHFRDLCKYLDACRERLWIAPVLEIARHLAEWRGISSADGSATSNRTGC